MVLRAISHWVDQRLPVIQVRELTMEQAIDNLQSIDPDKVPKVGVRAPLVIHIPMREKVTEAEARRIVRLGTQDRPYNVHDVNMDNKLLIISLVRK